MAQEYDIVILGGGTGGYVAAIRASQLGLKTAIVEKEKLGGTCLHKGCIPTKALLRSAEVFQTVKRSEDFGIAAKNITLQFEKIQARKNNIINQLHGGIKHLIKKGKIDVYEGIGRILGPSIFMPVPGTISVEMNNGSENQMLIPKNVVIATGSSPRTFPNLKVDGQYVITSEEALALPELPDSIIIIGGGVIGLEWASMYADFGVQVSLLEYADRILPNEDEEISKEMQRQMKKKGVNVFTHANVFPETIVKGNGVSISAEIQNKVTDFTADCILVAVGRLANIGGIGLENTEIETNEGVIVTNQFYQTKEKHMYAIGDCIGGLQLAHVAAREGIVAVEQIAGKNPFPVDYSQIAKCIYSQPEAASIGLTEDQAKEMGHPVKIGKFPFKAIGKALVFGETDGFVKMIADEKTDDILGIHMIGPHVTDLISEAGLAMVLDATPWEVANTVHPHPTLTEIIGEAALAVDGKAIHA